jgi:hypothetical protein
MINAAEYKTLFDEIVILDTEPYKQPNPENEKIFYVDLNSRTINVPDEFKSLAIQGDHLAETAWFVVDRYFDGRDLYNDVWGVQVEVPDENNTRKLLMMERKSKTTPEIIEKLVHGDKIGDRSVIFLGWPITFDVTQYAGDVLMSLCCFKKSDSEYALDSDGNQILVNGKPVFKLNYRLGTKPVKVEIEESLVLGQDKEGNPISPNAQRIEELIADLSDIVGEVGSIQIGWNQVKDQPKIDGLDLPPGGDLLSSEFKNIDFKKVKNVPKIQGKSLQDGTTDIRIKYSELDEQPTYSLKDKYKSYPIINGTPFDISTLKFDYSQIEGTPDMSYDQLDPNSLPKITVDGKELTVGVDTIEVSKIAVDAELSTTSTNPVQNKVIKAELDKIWEELGTMTFIPIEIKTFEADNYLYEIGSKATPTLSWSLSKEPVSLSLKANDIEVSNTNENYISAEIQEDTTFKLSVSDGKTPPAEDSLDIKFVNRVYWGVASEPESYDSAFVQTLDSELLETREKTFTVNALDNEYIYFAIPVSYGKAIISVNGFTNGFEDPQQIMVTNEYNSTNYYLYRSTNPNLGETTVVVS